MELAGAELDGVELAGALDDASELLAELGIGFESGLLLPPPPPPPQAVRPANIKERVKVFIRDCIVIPKLRCCYRGRVSGLLSGLVVRGGKASCKRYLCESCCYCQIR